MGMEIALIPAAMFIMGIGMMIYMKKKKRQPGAGIRTAGNEEVRERNGAAVI